MKSKPLNLSDSHPKPASSGGYRQPLSFRTLTTLKGYENLKEDEAIEHSFVSKSIIKGQDKIAAKVNFEQSANSQADWMERNIK